MTRKAGINNLTTIELGELKDNLRFFKIPKNIAVDINTGKIYRVKKDNTLKEVPLFSNTKKDSLKKSSPRFTAVSNRTYSATRVVLCAKLGYVLPSNLTPKAMDGNNWNLDPKNIEAVESTEVRATKDPVLKKLLDEKFPAGTRNYGNKEYAKFMNNYKGADGMTRAERSQYNRLHGVPLAE